jgi:hypothetical protein
MTPSESLESYRSMLTEHGELITIRRVNPNLPPTDADVLARVLGYQPEELNGGIMQGDRKIIFMAEDITLNPTLRAGDKVIVRGRMLNIERVDDSTRRVAGTLIAYELTGRG